MKLGEVSGKVESVEVVEACNGRTVILAVVTEPYGRVRVRRELDPLEVGTLLGATVRVTVEYDVELAL